MEVSAGQVNYRGSLPCSASNVLEPILHSVTGFFLELYLKLRHWQSSGKGWK